MRNSPYLAGHLLIAMPALQDPNFFQTVTYICEHSEEGALGLIINRPLSMDLSSIFEQLSLTSVDPLIGRQQVLQGGPVHQKRGFVLHELALSEGLSFDSTLPVSDTICMTTSTDILAAMARGQGPRRALVALGYAGWGAGQLENELGHNTWLSVPATPQIIFETPFELRREAATRLLGIELSTLSHQSGHA